MQAYKWQTYPELKPFYLPALAIYSLFFVIFFGLATAGLRYQHSISHVVPMTVTSALLTCRFDIDKPGEQNKNSQSYSAPCDDAQQAERLRKLGFIHVRPTSLHLKLRSLSAPAFETQLETGSSLEEPYHVGQTVQIRLAKLRNNERAEFASRPPSYEITWTFFKIALLANLCAWLAIAVNHFLRRRSTLQSTLGQITSNK
jgi:hypothetical protein